MSEPNKETQEDRELREAQERVSAARQAKAAAEAVKMAALQTEIAEKKAQRERQIFNEQETARLIQAKWAKKRQDEEEARAQKIRDEKAQQAALEQQVAKQEEVLRIQREHEAKVKKLTEEAFLIEQEQKRVEAETIAALSRAAAQESGTGDTSCSADDPYAQHPLRRFIKGVDTEPSATIAAASAPTLTPTAKSPRKPCVPDGNDVVALEKLWYSATQERPSPMKFEVLLGKGYSVCEIETALRAVQTQGRPMSSDGRLYAVECVLEGASDAQAS